MAAADSGNTECCRVLIEHGARLTDTDGTSRTAMFIAASNSRVEALHLLLRHGSDPDHPNSGGYLALHFAAYNGNAEVVQALLAAGANPDGKGDNRGDDSTARMSPLEYAKQGIRINNVSPAAIETEMFLRAMDSEEKRGFIASLHPVGRVGRSEEVTKAIVFLLDPDNTFVTGTSLLVDGGGLAKA